MIPIKRAVVDMDSSDLTLFNTSSRAILDLLYRRIGFGLWMTTQTIGDDWIVLQAEDHGYGVNEGSVFRWSDSFCRRMVAGQGPRVAHQAMDIAAYAVAPIAQQFPIGAYIGVPLEKADGSLFGTICAIDPKPQDESIRHELPAIELYAKLLGTILTTETSAIEQGRLLRICHEQTSTDLMTGLLNRKGWEESVVREESLARRHAITLSVFIINLDNLKQTNDAFGHAKGDELIRRTAACLRTVLRTSDIIARIGGDEFAVIAIDCTVASSAVLLAEINKAIVKRGINASAGTATRHSAGGLQFAINRAGQRMYATKALRRIRKNNYQET